MGASLGTQKAPVENATQEENTEGKAPIMQDNWRKKGAILQTMNASKNPYPRIQFIGSPPP